jgi:inner membrane protein involved in colicin E2 resistance
MLFEFKFNVQINTRQHFFSYYVMGLALNCFQNTLLLLQMYTKFSTCFVVNWCRTLLQTNEYEFQFHSHDNVEHTCANM